MFLTIAIFIGIGVVCGVLIFLMSKILSKEDETLAKTGVLAEILFGMNCGACGQFGCFAYV